MDATYKESAIAQIEGNPTINLFLKEDLTEIFRLKSESTMKRMCKQDGKGRFFYDSDESDLAADLDKIVTQAEVNKLRRQGYEFQSAEINEKFPATYRRGGHYYINGYRQY